MRWEYRAVALWPRVGNAADGMNDTGDVTSLLNALGAEGWELVAVEWLVEADAPEGRVLTAIHEAARGVMGTREISRLRCAPLEMTRPLPAPPRALTRRACASTSPSGRGGNSRAPTRDASTPGKVAR